MSPTKVPLVVGDLDPMDPWDSMSPHCKRHLDWFSCVCNVQDCHNRHVYRQTMSSHDSVGLYCCDCPVKSLIVQLHLIMQWTGCCSTGSERSHRCRHLLSKVDNIDHMPDIAHTMLYGGLGYTPKIDPSPSRIWTPPNNSFLVPPQSKWHYD